MRRATLNLGMGLLVWLVMASACGEVDYRLCEALDVRGQWHGSGGVGDLRVSGSLNDVTVSWIRDQELDGESSQLNMVRWRPQVEAWSAEVMLGEGAAVQDPADNIAPRTNAASLVVASDDIGCWPLPFETHCRLWWRLELTGTTGSDTLSGSVSLVRRSGFVDSTDDTVRSWRVSFRRNTPLGGSNPGCRPKPDGGADGGSGGSGGGCGGGSTASSRRDGGSSSGSWGGSSSGWGGSSGWASSSSSSSSGGWEPDGGAAPAGDDAGLAGAGDGGGNGGPGDGGEPVDAGSDGGATDGGATADAGEPDAGGDVSGVVDSGVLDSGVADAGTALDAGATALDGGRGDAPGDG